MGYIFDGGIKLESAQRLIDYMKNNKEVKLYLTTTGGSITHCHMLAQHINTLGKPIEIITDWEVSSAGFLLLLLVKCPIQVLSNTFSVIHLMSRSIHTRDLNDEYNQTSVINKQLEKNNDRWITIYKKIGIMDYEIKQMRLGKSVVLTSKRVIEAIQTYRKLPENEKYKNVVGDIE